MDAPKSIYDSIIKFESGQIYQVVTKNDVGNFVPFKQNDQKDQLLIYIFT
jgi:hypothetical protein